MLLLSRYQEAADASTALLPRFCAGGKATDGWLQRALVTAFQAQFFMGRQDEVDAIVDKLGFTRLAVPTFMAWALLLLESGQAATARQRVEQYMAVVAAHPRSSSPQQTGTGRQQAPASADPPALDAGPPGPAGPRADEATAASAPRSADCALQVERELGAERQGPQGGADAAGENMGVGAAAASPQDRAALARLYSQDVLCLGLGLPMQALHWLQPQQAPPQQHQQMAGGVKAGCSARPTCTAAAAAVVDAAELVGCEETLRRLHEELGQLIAVAGLVPPQGLGLGLPDASGASGANGANGIGAAGGNGGAAAQQAKPASALAPAAAGPGGATAPHRAADGAPAADASAAGCALQSRGRIHSGATNPAGRLLAAPLPAAGSVSFFRALLAAAHALARRLLLGVTMQLSRAQAWVVCRATAAVARLRGLSAGGGGSAGALLWGRVPLGRVALAAALAAVVLVAAQAEAPYLRTNVERQWGRLAGMVGEALRMGLALHPSPVATAAHAVH